MALYKPNNPGFFYQQVDKPISKRDSRQYKWTSNKKKRREGSNTYGPASKGRSLTAEELEARKRELQAPAR